MGFNSGFKGLILHTSTPPNVIITIHFQNISWKLQCARHK